jgi:protein subunit release factor A
VKLVALRLSFLSLQDKHYLDAALNQSEAARLALLKENDALRDTILACANALQSVHHIALGSMTENELEDPQLILSQTLFNATNGEETQAITALAKLRNLFSQLRDSVGQIIEDRDTQRQAKQAQQQELEELRDLAAEYEARLRECLMPEVV